LAGLCAVGNSGWVSTIESREEVARAEAAGERFGNKRVAEAKGERTLAGLRRLGMTRTCCADLSSSLDGRAGAAQMAVMGG
jgi:hypothetical protein